MKLSMMTLGCPEWDLDTICREAGRLGFGGVDFRGIRGDLDVTTLPAFTTDAASTVRLLSDHGLVASGISTSIQVCAPERRTQSLDEARRTLDAAVAVGASNVRVFGEGKPETIGYPEAARHGRDCVEAILALPGARQVSWNFETHDSWVRSTDCKLLLAAVTDSAFGAAWDLGHTRRVGGETAEQTLEALGDRIRYVHVKDAVRADGHPNVMKDGWRYVMPGDGELQLAHAVRLLLKTGYDGWFMFEHEKRWHPDLEPPEVAFPTFIRWAQQFRDA
ncbi:MAG TPA: sugar phosphate isomerase/epimerase [Tepidisphaeraceae bacterium]